MQSFGQSSIVHSQESRRRVSGRCAALCMMYENVFSVALAKPLAAIGGCDGHFLYCFVGSSRRPLRAHRRATLVIAKLDRLARNIHFITGLMESGVDFVAVDMPKPTQP
jgi:hypothetical protein